MWSADPQTETPPVSAKRWENAVTEWVQVRMAHRCRRGVVILFVEPRDGLDARCVRCGESLRRGAVLPSDGSASPAVREGSSRSTGGIEHGSLVARRVEERVGSEVPTEDVGEKQSPKGTISEIAPPSEDEAIANAERILGASPADDLATTVAKAQSAVEVVHHGDYLETEEVGTPISDNEVRALGFEPTSKGWIPIEGATDAA